MDTEKQIKLNNKQIKENLQERIVNYFEERKKRNEFNHHVSIKFLKNDWNFEKYMEQIQCQKMLTEI